MGTKVPQELKYVIHTYIRLWTGKVAFGALSSDRAYKKKLLWQGIFFRTLQGGQRFLKTGRCHCQQQKSVIASLPLRGLENLTHSSDPFFLLGGRVKSAALDETKGWVSRTATIFIFSGGSHKKTPDSKRKEENFPSIKIRLCLNVHDTKHIYGAALKHWPKTKMIDPLEYF